MDQSGCALTTTLGRGGAGRKTEMATCLTELAQRMGRREIVVVFSDFFTDLSHIESAIHVSVQQALGRA